MLQRLVVTTIVGLGCAFGAILGLYSVGSWYIPIFIFIIIASAFSANETDGLDGLAGGVMLCAIGLDCCFIAMGRYHPGFGAPWWSHPRLSLV